MKPYVNEDGRIIQPETPRNQPNLNQPVNNLSRFHSAIAAADNNPFNNLYAYLDVQVSPDLWSREYHNISLDPLHKAGMEFACQFIDDRCTIYYPDSFRRSVFVETETKADIEAFHTAMLRALLALERL